MRMTAGVINVRVRALDGNDQIEIDTPNLALSLLRPGNYRVEVNDAGDTTVVKSAKARPRPPAVRRIPSCTLSRPSRSAATTISSRSSARWARPTISTPGAWSAIGATIARRLRGRRSTCRPTSRATKISTTTARGAPSPNTATCGRRRASPWAGRRIATAAGCGSRPWGWTWIDDAPWGYAPFHYGRWAHVRNRWCWVPGPRHVRAVYAPALVGWVGSPGVSVRFLRRRRRLVPARPARSLCAGAPLQPALRGARERLATRDREPHVHHRTCTTTAAQHHVSESRCRAE